MNLRQMLVAAALVSAAASALAAPPDPAARSISGNGQFIIYCPDTVLRSRIASLVVEVKSELLALLGEGTDRWKIPVVITLDQAQAPGQAPVKFQMIATPGGSKIEIDAEIGNDPTAINLRRQIVRAILLEIAWRDRPPIPAGQQYLEAPWWLVDGAIEILRRRDSGVDAELFRRLVENNKLPTIEQFLTLRGSDLGRTAEAIDCACAMALVQLLLEQSNGQANLGRLIRHWPTTGDDPLAALTRDFPGLAMGNGTLQKWWTLNLARFAASDRYQGLTAAESDARLAPLLQIELVIDKAGTKKTFTLGEFDQFLKLPKARETMVSRQAAAVALGAEVNVLFRPVCLEYEQIFALLARGKKRGVAERLATIESYRAIVLHRMDEIADYLNWYEATQLGTRSNAFDGYLKAVEELAREENRRSDPIAQYLDRLQEEY
jgi:hypothetical protein